MTIGQAIDHVMRRIVELNYERDPICYQASEAVYYLAGGKKAGLTVMKNKARGHWFLEGPNGEIIDLTAGQFHRHKLPSYRAAKPVSFFPNKSSLCKLLMR
jgi:hypothetical protein